MLQQALTFLILGGGSIGTRHIRNLQKLGYTDIYCLKRKADQEFAATNQVQVITSVEELEGKPVHAVFVCTPTSLHNQGMSIAKTLNAAVFMEKPLIHDATGLEEAQQVQASGSAFFIGFMLRYHPLVKQLKTLVEGNEIGQVYSARFSFGSYLPNWHPWEDHKEGYAARKSLGGGVINTITHELDLVQYLFGKPKSIVASKANLNKLQIEVEELAEAILEYDDKLVSLHLDYLQKEYDRNITILGDEGWIRWNWHDQQLTAKRVGEEIKTFSLPDFDVNNLYLDELTDFIRILEQKEINHPLNFEHAVLNTQLMLAIHQAADEGKRTYINNH